MRVLKSTRATVRESGAEHSGWLPGGASVPSRTPECVASYEIRIIDDGAGFLLVSWEDGAERESDSWFATLEGAEEAARDWFGVRESDWAEG